MQDLSNLKVEVERWETLQKRSADALELLELAEKDQGTKIVVLYVEPGGVGRVLAPCAQGTTPSSCTATEPGPVFENVAFDPRWLGARDGRFFGPMSWAN